MDEFQEKRAELTMTLRGLGITDSPVLSAIERVPRDIFVPQALRAHAYEMHRCQSPWTRPSASPMLSQE